MKTTKTRILAVALGDVTGIGPEVTLKAVARAGAGIDTSYVLIGDAACIDRLGSSLGLHLHVVPYHEGRCEPGKVYLRSDFTPSLPQGLSAGAPEAARAAVEWVRAGALGCLRGEFDGLVTAPVNKEAIVRAGIPFVGQTEMLSELAKTDRTAMMLLGQDDRGRWLRVALATTHVPIREVSQRLRKDKVVSVIELAAEACAKLGLPRAKVAVCGLNPHAGEGGHIGTEEIDLIAPAVADARNRGLNVTGPLSADALFHYAYRGDYDVVVAMYHDQGLAPLKMVAFEQGVNWTLGLPFVRTSPDHGTAYDIAGRGIARETSMAAAIGLAGEVIERAESGRRVD